MLRSLPKDLKKIPCNAKAFSITQQSHFSQNNMKYNSQFLISFSKFCKTNIKPIFVVFSLNLKILKIHTGQSGDVLANGTPWSADIFLLILCFPA